MYDVVLLNCSSLNAHSMTQLVESFLFIKTLGLSIGSGTPNDVEIDFTGETGKDSEEHFSEVILA